RWAATYRSAGVAAAAASSRQALASARCARTRCETRGPLRPPLCPIIPHSLSRSTPAWIAGHLHRRRWHRQNRVLWRPSGRCPGDRSGRPPAGGRVLVPRAARGTVSPSRLLPRPGEVPPVARVTAPGPAITGFGPARNEDAAGPG